MKVGIVGLGAAGLRAAMLLEQAGVTVSLFEARKRLGGRIYTHQNGKTCYDAGGEWLDSDHRRSLNLLQELGIEPDPTSGWPGKVHFDGQQCFVDALWSDALEDELSVEAAAKELCRDLNIIPWKNTHHPELESRTLGDFLRENTSTKRGLWWVWANYRSDEGDDPDKISLLGWLCGFLNYIDRDSHAMSAYRVKGGMGELVKAMAKRLTAKPHLGSELRRVRQDSECVTLQFNTHEVEVDQAILTLPPPSLEYVVFEPALQGSKRCAIEACHMSKAIKIAWEFDKFWWRDEGWNGSMFTNSGIQQVWDASRNETPILCAYICGEDAVRFLQCDDPVTEAFADLVKLEPTAKEHFVRGWTHDWINDKHSHGAFSHLGPGYVLEWMQHIRTAESRIHFAGEHTALWTGFIEGALESAERVVEEILNA